MTKEGEPPLLEASHTGEDAALAKEDEQSAAISATPEPIHEEREPPKATLRELRAARSLLYNRLLLEIVQRRIEKAETIILSYLLTQGDTEAQIGPYLVVLDAAHHIDVTKTCDDGWYQLYFTELDSVVMG